MISELHRLVQETSELTGASLPGLLDVHAPVLQINPQQQIYLVGLIGGKDVGKSSLVNALIGQPISADSDSGPGTELAIAYAHESAADELLSLLESIVPGKFRIVTHRVGTLKQQVLVDLPDIDSHWKEHVALTRQMLRHMLFPIWIQSVEKYADRQPQQLLQQVAAGNDPQNFLFCLNKCDQLSTEDAARLSADYGARLQQSLAAAQLPRVYLISTRTPAGLDFPALRQTLSNQKSTALVTQSRQLAARRQDFSLLQWLDHQQLASRAERGQRMLHEAEELLAGRVAAPLLEQAIPKLTGDIGYRLSIIDPVVQRRLSHWPIANVLQTALVPLFALIRRNLETTGDTTLRTPALQGAFALLQQSNPTLGPMYRSRKLWEQIPAEIAETQLRQRITDTVEQQKQQAIERIGGGSILLAPVRWGLTIGAALWFPIAQPILQVVLAPGWTGSSREATYLAVQLISAAYLLKTIGFLTLYFVVLWVFLRWDTHRRVIRFIRRINSGDGDANLSLVAQVMSWMDELLEPLRRDAEIADELSQRMVKIREKLMIE